MQALSGIYDWLLDPVAPSIRYRTLTELLARPPDDPDVLKAKQAIPTSKAVTDILRKMHPDGYWLQKNPRTGELLGDGTVYGSFATTHFCLAYLAELGMDKEHPQVRKAGNRYLSLQKEDGDFWRHFSCLYSYNIRTFIQLGWREDPRVQKSIDLMLNTARPDGGYLCDTHEGKYKTRAVKSCIRGSVKALIAFAELPEYKAHPRCTALVDYFLKRGGIFRSDDRSELVNKDVDKLFFPITWKASLVEIAYALSKMGYGQHKALDAMWAMLEKKQDTAGRYPLDWTPSQALLKVGKRGEPNKWITFYALLARKYRNGESA